MIYLDYSSEAPISYEALDIYNKVAKEYIGNFNSSNLLIKNTNNLYKELVKTIADNFNMMESEITFTSGATEANNLALIGVALAKHKKGKHLIVSQLEHFSIYKICDYLESIGFEISYVKNDEDGLIDFDDLKRLVREDTILVSICALNNEIGIRQPLKMIRQIIKKENPNIILHSDMAQALGKIYVNFHDVDLASISSHKLFGPTGIGFLYHSENIKIVPLTYGAEIDKLNSYTLSLPLLAAFTKALNLASNDLEKKEHFVSRLNEKICLELAKYEDVILNKTKYSVPHILNLSLINIDSELFEKALAEKDILVRSNYNELNVSVMSIFNNQKRALSTLKISLSYKTTTDEINKFIIAFKEIYEKYKI